MVAVTTIAWGIVEYCHTASFGRCTPLYVSVIKNELLGWPVVILLYQGATLVAVRPGEEKEVNGDRV